MKMKVKFFLLGFLVSLVSFVASSYVDFRGYQLLNLDNGITPIGRVILPMGELDYFNTTGTVVAIAAISDGSTNMVKVVATTTTDGEYQFDNGGADNGRLRYTGTTTRIFHVAATISFNPAVVNETFVIGIAKNGIVQDHCKVLQKNETFVDVQSTAMHCMTELSMNDYLELYVGNMTSAGDFTIKTINMFAMGL